MKNLVSLLLFSIFFLDSYGQTVSNAEYSKMLKGLLDHSVPEVSVTDISPNEKVIYLDAREINEYEVSHIQSAIWVGYDQFQKSALKQVPKDSKIIVYCSVGYRSEKISEKLIKMGYKDVSNLYGGLFEWANQEMTMVNDSNQTNSIHAYDKDWGKWVTKGTKVY
ncbi:MAG: rhodanese-like domain-containing protein [Salibacteraceae bacterium]